MIKIEQPFNNNVVMGWDRKHGEVVIVGKGIGFHAKKGDIIDESKIQKIFVANENEKLEDFNCQPGRSNLKYLFLHVNTGNLFLQLRLHTVTGRRIKSIPFCHCLCRCQRTG